MKNTKLFGWALMALASFSACTNDAEEVFAKENEIKLKSEITPSRVASLDYQSTQIVTGQQVGVTITDAKTEHNNIAWSVGDNGALNNTSTPVFFGNNQATITAYHPYNAAWTGTSHDFAISTDQSGEENYRNSDLLWATATSSKTDTAVPLVFKHKLAKINVTLVTEEEDENLNGAIISICNTKISTTFNPATGEISDATGESQEIIAGITADDVYTASAIVIPQEVSGKFIKIIHGSKTYYYTLASAKTLASGKSYSYTLTVKGKQLINTDSSIDEWEDESGNVGDAEEEVITIPNNQIWYTSSDGNVVIPYFMNEFGATITSNTYENGKGIITFDNNVTTIGYASFSNCSSLSEITIPNSVTTIGYAAFSGCSSLIEISIPNSVTTTGEHAFENCTSLAKITIPNGVTTIDEASFENCTSLTEITIPNSVTRIGIKAFAGCKSLTRVNIKATTPPWCYLTSFDECSNSLAIYVPAESIEAYKKANHWAAQNILPNNQ